VAAFRAYLSNVEDFVIVFRTKDGQLKLQPCLDPEVGVWDFIDAVRAAHIDHLRHELSEPSGRQTSRQGG